MIPAGERPSVAPALRYENGTIWIDAGDDSGVPAVDALSGVEWDPRSKTGRAPAFRYANLSETLANRGVDADDRVLDLPDLDLASAYELRDYQGAALSAWGDADHRGTLELPTGSGKTVIGLKAMERRGTPTLVVVPAITHQTGTGERRRLLENFREGTYSRIVTSNVLDEGVDVPDANVAIVLSGSGSEREFVQRLGRVLRPNEDDTRALMYEVVSRDTAEENVAGRRR
ncbi:MAG: helicase-related protein [Halobacteriales archaeon]